MYFDNVDKFNLEEYIKNSDKIYAHVFENEEKDIIRTETLKEHLELSIKYFYKIIENKELDNVFSNFEINMINGFSDEGKVLFKEMLKNTIYMHDLGKINCNFQYYKMRNDFFKEDINCSLNNSNHSMLSSLIYINHYFIKIKQHKEKSENGILRTIMLLNAYVISKHHGNFDSFDRFKEKFLDLDEEGYKLCGEELSLFSKVYKEEIVFNSKNKFLYRLFKNAEKLLDNSEQENKLEGICFYIYERFLSSILLACDYYSTSNFKNGLEIKDFGKIGDIEEFYKSFKDTDVYKSIRKYENKNYGKTKDFSDLKDINVLRDELFLDSEKSMLKNIDRDIFYLEAPTGSGKSNAAFNLSFKIIEKFKNINKIFYVYPFNTLIEQNIETLNKIFKGKDIMDKIAVINSLVPIKTEKIHYKDIDKKESSDVLDENYEISLLNRQFLHYPMILTTHVSLFNYFFGISKENIFPFAQIANSVIVLDEIQSYKNSIWKEIITFFKYYSKLLNIKIIIMSATLPNLDTLSNEKVNAVKLIGEREKYYSNPIFKNRVSLDFSLLDQKEEVFDKLFQHVINQAEKAQDNILIEFINKKLALKFFNELNEQHDLVDYKGENKRKILLITGDDNSIDRNHIIKCVKNEKNITLVATQVIEAGVDIDMDIGYKDISMLDSEEQFLGRINRSCKNKKGGKVYFFNLYDASRIYKNDVRKEKHLNLMQENIRDILNDKNFSAFYDCVLDELNRNAEKHNDLNFYKFIEENIDKLNFKKVEDRMKLIDERYEYTVYLSRDINLNDEKNTVLHGDEIWQKYIEILKNNKINYAEKKIKLSEITSKLNYFIYKVNSNDFAYNDRIGDIYFIEDGEKYFVSGKFDRENFNRGIGDFI
ncbi:CRISPR-associated helicase Cas3' [Haloimpatiens sp. FM7315]|uniref:CRISPR-associated helicase Cas3' n=1 Tax=Haloimpatiens sp. FM7315 TaxID=3298609 RepID=UPI00370A43EE